MRGKRKVSLHSCHFSRVRLGLDDNCVWSGCPLTLCTVSVSVCIACVSVCVHACMSVWTCRSADHEGHQAVEMARGYRGSLNEDGAAGSGSWSSPYTERNVSHSVAYTSTGKGRLTCSH